jgi:hypothetical protein
MRRLIPFVFLIAASWALAQSNRDPEGPEPPPLSEVIKKNASSSTATGQSKVIPTEEQDHQPIADSAAPPDPDIRVIRKADATLEEYRFNGKLYMVKVTPKMGKPYYLYDEEGTGNLIRRDDTHSHIAPPRWTLFSW